MNREQALELVQQNLKNKNLIKHSLAVEACMRALAAKFGEDVEKWGLAGILHDIDYELTAESPENHGVESMKILEEYDIDPDILHSIQAHAERAECSSKMDWAIYSVDPLTGFIVAATLMHPSKKIKQVDLGFLKRRYKEKSFARGAKRGVIEKIKETGLELEEFMDLSLKAMQNIDRELGL
ncbi:MAG: HDIG domain-containing protein [Candidatus Aminicenantes bacterium]|nr:HDIG domain-containing protein [Candidatus Aminicenantes bacterium]